MPFTLTMPKLSPTMEGGSITKWLKSVGDIVAPGDVLFEVATDKATVEYNALDGGFLRAILLENGKDALVGQPIAVFSETKSEDISSYKPEGILPQVPERAVQEEEKVFVATEKKLVEPTSSLRQPAFTPEPPLEEYAFPFPEEGQAGRVRATPYAKKVAKEKGIDLLSVKGTGPRQRIESRDLVLGQEIATSRFARRERPSVPPGSYEEVSLSPMRKVIAERLQQAKSFIPHFYLTQKIRAEAILALREQLKAGEVKVTVNDIVIRALALALCEHPAINSGFNSVSQKIIRFQSVDISVAVSVEQGLITPILRQADYKSLGQISTEVRYLAKKAKEGKLSREEYVGGSFTLSNLGMFGISQFFGIINPPQGAILCIGGVEDQPVVKEGAVVPGKIMTLSLSADHRVIDGTDGAKFLRSLQHLLENPSLLLL